MSDKKTFAQKVAAFLKMDDEGKVGSFQAQSLKIIAKQIKTREDLLVEKQEERKEYVDEKSPEIVLNVNVNRIKTIQDRKEYFEGVYLPTLLNVTEAVTAFDDEIEVMEQKIARLKEVAELLKDN